MLSQRTSPVVKHPSHLDNIVIKNLSVKPLNESNFVNL